MTLILPSLALVYYCFPALFQFVLYVVHFTVTSLLGLLVLNLLVLYVYVKYIISPIRKAHLAVQARGENMFPSLVIAKSPSAWQQQIKREQPASSLPISTHAPINASFNRLVHFVLRDFIQSWYVNIATPSPLATSDSFPLAIDRLVNDAARSLVNRLQQTDRTALLLNHLLPRLTTHIADFRAAETSLRGRFLERTVTASDEMDLLIASHYHGGKLHPALTTAAVSTKPTEVAYLRKLMDRLLPKLLPQEHLTCLPVHCIVREILVGALLQPIMQMIADPDFWNQTLDVQLGKVLREQKMVQQLREVLNRHSSDMDVTSPLSTMSPLNEPTTTLGQLSSNFLGLGTHGEDEIAWDDQDFDPDKQQRASSRLGRRTFQSFLRMIDEEPDILELKRLRNDLVTQIRKKRVLVADRDPEEVVDGEKVEDLNVYLHRLGVAKKKVDKRIAFLSGEQPDFALKAAKFFGVRKPRPSMSTFSGFTLMDILTNTAGLSYFMEFMDRREDLVKLQFWLMVEGFKSTDDTKQDMFVQDAQMVMDMYFTAGAPHRLTNVPEPLIKDLDSALQHHQHGTSAGRNKTDVQHRLNILQQHIFWQMEKEDYPYFKRSDLYFKFLASTPTPEPTTSSDRHSLDEHSLTTPSSSSSLNTLPPTDLSPPPQPTVSASLFSRKKHVSASAALSQRTSPRKKTTPPPALIVENTESTRLFKPPHDEGKPALLSTNGLLASFSSITSRPLPENSVNSQPPSKPVTPSSPRQQSKAEPTAAATTVSAAPWYAASLSSPASSINTLPKLDSLDDPDVEPEDESEVGITEPNTHTIPSDPVDLDDAQSMLHQTTVEAVEAELQSIMDGMVPLSPRPDQPAPLEPAPPEHLPPDDTNPVQANDDTNSRHPPVALSGPMLADEVQRLGTEIDKLIQQEVIVDALIKKAEAKDKQNELRILVKSKAMFQHEREQFEFQRLQYEQQQSENFLAPERTHVSITNATIGSDAHGEFAVYVIELQQFDMNGHQTSGWVVTRRFSEFFDLHQLLKTKFSTVRTMAFPTKWPLLKLQKAFVEARRSSLERYLRQLLSMPGLCQCDALKTFLSQQQATDPALATPTSPALPTSFHTATPSSPASSRKAKVSSDAGFMRHIYNTVATSIDDLLMGPSMLDLITQHLGEQTLDTNLATPLSTSSSTSSLDNLTSPPSSTSASTTWKPVESEGLTRFSEPLCDLFIETFELKEKNNWLRRQAVVILLQQIFGGTVERKIRDTLNDWESESMLLFYMQKITDSMWPNGAKWQSKLARMPEHKLHTKDEANRKLSTWLPDMLGGMVGRQNARRGARRLFNVLQNQRLNQHLVYVLLDEVISALFPDVDMA
ncbi:hypothetical protein DM01DRAFT_1340339 [Hesseltinella vesiculosa]|uniref:PXA domain-containing protein n=1 Tax=Hesseltinella vesiculosa TaxID=101127 RepID=A0A1X2G5E0_9FUNG|nr:hypothetical protein DM01DRAFT_1340339 [Hesseltinella vesiculosa]